MPIIIACAVVLLGGLALGSAWGGLSFVSPPTDVELSPWETGRRFVWYAALVLAGGVIAGITVIGAGGRLAMRLLAVTGGDAAQGRLTEADETVGRITVDGTIGFVLFNGIFGGVAAAAIYMVVRRLLPGAWSSGALFGAGLLVVLGTTVDPLRSDNPDFDIVGPGWLAGVVFVAMGLAFGVVLAGVMAKLSTWLPLPAWDRRVLLRYIGPALLAAVAFSVTTVLLVVGLVVVGITRWQPVVDAVRSRRWIVVGRVVLFVGIAVALPNAAGNIADIVTR